MKGTIKRIWLVLAVVLISGTWGSAALAEERPKRVISVTGAGLVQLYEEKPELGTAVFQGGLGLEYEKVTSPGSSLYVTPAITFSRKALGVRATVGLKNYFKPTAPQGLWWGFYGGFGAGADWGTEEDWGASVSIVGAGVNMGYKYLLGENLTAEWSCGAIYLQRSGKDIDVGGLGPTVAIKLGWAF